MANTYKNNITAITATGSSEVIYTCPSNATAIVNTIFVYNGAVGTADYTIYLTDTSTSTTKKDCRARGRQAAINISNSAVNETWRFGTFRADIKPAGRR